MDLTRVYDPELLPPLEVFLSQPQLNWEDLPGTRALLREALRQMTTSFPDSPNVVKEDHRVPGPEGAPAVPVRLYRPKGESAPLPALLWIHGGGYVIGSVEQDDLLAQHLAESVGCLVASVDYRLAPEHPFPAAVEDCYAALKWMASRADELGLDRRRLAIGGASAGGGLTAALALLTRDRGEIPLIFQLLIYPMLDDRDATRSSELFAEAPIWNREDNRRGWRAYLGEAAGGPDVSPYAAAARAQDLRGLPPAFMAVGAAEIFLDEDVDYALRLAHAGVPVELQVYPRAYHAWDGIAPLSRLAQQFVANRDRALREALHPQSAGASSPAS
ncbi:alpha/beta hydrolase [Thermogemmatispora sp.]|uniref:alpha/beta hydrolase n=1 Tax=Thermogemmatispora sp. TaxID=1968838 RepID=UPI001DCA0B5B|nr:alpha/beta hydrolase [Thermogemmatispora sp.]MBX5449994.1 alpha/beta hydrolase [Thermogemmatispora sp.]